MKASQLLIVLAAGIVLTAIVAYLTRPEILTVKIPLEALVDVEGYGADVRNMLAQHLTLYMTVGTMISGLVVAVLAGVFKGASRSQA